MFADQSSQEYEHAEKPKDPSHAKPLLCNLRQARVHDTLRRHGESGRGLRSNHLPRSKGRPSSCKDDVGSLRGVLATSSRPCRTQAADCMRSLAYGCPMPRSSADSMTVPAGGMAPPELQWRAICGTGKIWRCSVRFAIAKLCLRFRRAAHSINQQRWRPPCPCARLCPFGPLLHTRRCGPGSGSHALKQAARCANLLINPRNCHPLSYRANRLCICSHILNQPGPLMHAIHSAGIQGAVISLIYISGRVLVLRRVSCGAILWRARILRGTPL